MRTRKPPEWAAVLAVSAAIGLGVAVTGGAVQAQAPGQVTPSGPGPAGEKNRQVTYDADRH